MSSLTSALEGIGRWVAAGIAQFGFGATLFAESVFWTLLGRSQRQPVHPRAIVAEMMQVGILALPIVSVLAATIGVMLAIQGIYTLRTFGAESRVSIGIGLSVVREFAPLITGILVAGRSGSALAARLGTMSINQEIDALRVMGINPVRFLVAPSLIAMLVMVPALTLWSMLVALFASGLYVSAELDISLAAYRQELVMVIRLNDLWHGLGKSVIFAGLIAIVGVVNGAGVSGGAEGVGRATTRSVVQAISAIVITDMIFVFVVTHT